MGRRSWGGEASGALIVSNGERRGGVRAQGASSLTAEARLLVWYSHRLRQGLVERCIDLFPPNSVGERQGKEVPQPQLVRLRDRAHSQVEDPSPKPCPL